MLLQIKLLANGASSFSAPSTIDGVSTISTTTVTSASGGAEPETLSSIKLQAPLDFASQGRAVTTEDYKVYARKLFPNTQLYLCGVERTEVLTHHLEYHLHQSMEKFLYQSKVQLV